MYETNKTIHKSTKPEDSPKAIFLKPPLVKIPIPKAKPTLYSDILRKGRHKISVYIADTVSTLRNISKYKNVDFKSQPSQYSTSAEVKNETLYKPETTMRLEELTQQAQNRDKLLEYIGTLMNLIIAKQTRSRTVTQS